MKSHWNLILLFCLLSLISARVNGQGPGKQPEKTTEAPTLAPPMLDLPQLSPESLSTSGVGNSGRYIASNQIIVSWTKDFDVAWGFSKSVGKWAKQEMDPPASGRPAVSIDMAVWQVGSTFYAFSGTVGRWDVLKLLADHKPRLSIPSNDYVLVNDGDDVHTFAASTGRWSSPEGEESVIETPPADNSDQVKVFTLHNARAVDVHRIISDLYGREGLTLTVDERTNSLIARGPTTLLDIAYSLITRLDEPLDPTSKPKTLTSDSSAAVAERSKQYEAKEQQAATIAQQLRSAKQLNAPEKTRLEADLRRAVAQAFAARQKLHEAELAHIANRLRGLEQTIVARQKIADQIIDRRVEDLLNPNLRWESSPLAQSNPLTSPAGSPAKQSATFGTSSSPSPRITFGTWFPAEFEQVWTALGIKVQPLTAADAPKPQYRGALKVVEVSDDRPAGGLQVGDIIVTAQAQSGSKSGRTVTLRILRGEQNFPVTVEFPATSAVQSSGARRSVSASDSDLAAALQKLEPAMGGTVNPDADRIIWNLLGVTVETVGRKPRANSPLNIGLLVKQVDLRWPLRPGDIVVGLQDWHVGSKAQLAWALLQPLSENLRLPNPQTRSTKEEAVLYFLRDDEPQSISVILPPWPSEGRTIAETPAPPDAPGKKGKTLASGNSTRGMLAPSDLTSARAYRDKLREQWDAMEALFNGGRVSTERMLQLASDLGPAEIAAAATADERRTALKEHVERVKRVKKIVEDKHNADVEPIQNLRAAEAALIKAEAQLAAANQSDTALAPPVIGPLPSFSFPSTQTGESLILKNLNQFRETYQGLQRAIAQNSKMAEGRSNRSRDLNDDEVALLQKSVVQHQGDLNFLKQQYAAQLRLLELDLQDAKSAVETTGKEYDSQKSLFDSGVRTGSEAREAQRAHEAAKLRLEKAKTLLDLYRKADPQTKSAPQAESDTAPMAPPAKSNAAAKPAD